MGVASAASGAASQASSQVAANATKTASAGNVIQSSTPTAPGSPSTPKPSNSSQSVLGSPSNNPSNGSHSSLPDIEEGMTNNKTSDLPNEMSDLDSNDMNQGENHTPNEESIAEDKTKKNNPQDIDDGKYHAKDNQEVGPGQKLDENGNVVDSGNKKFTKALAIGAATYAGGVEGGETANALTKTEAGDKLTGVVGDALDKAPVAGKITEDLGDSGVADAITDTADTLSAAKSGDIKGAAKSGVSAIKNLDKAVKHYAAIILLSLLGILAPIIVVCVIIGAVCGPVLGGFMDVTSAFGEFVDDVGDFFTGENDISGTTGGDSLQEIMENADQIVAEVPDFSSLTAVQQGIVSAAAAGVASGKPYSYGGKPIGPGITGIPDTGIDCSGFVGWSIWTATGKRPSAMGTSTIIDQIGSDFVEISESELRPGDIGLKHKNSSSNHTGIYAGNGLWLHAANSRTGLVRSNYKSFTVYLRYVG